MGRSKFLLFAACADFCVFRVPLVLGDMSDRQESSVQAQIQSVYDASDAAGSKMDLSGMFAKCDPKCTFIGLEGPKEILKTEKRDFRTLFIVEKVNALNELTKIQSVKLLGNAAVITATEHVSLVGALNGPLTETTSYTSRDYWILTKHGWRELRTKLLTGKEYDNGELQDYSSNDHW